MDNVRAPVRLQGVMLKDAVSVVPANKLGTNTLQMLGMNWALAISGERTGRQEHLGRTVTIYLGAKTGAHRKDAP